MFLVSAVWAQDVVTLPTPTPEWKWWVGYTSNPSCTIRSGGIVKSGTVVEELAIFIIGGEEKLALYRRGRFDPLFIYRLGDGFYWFRKKPGEWQVFYGIFVSFPLPQGERKVLLLNQISFQTYLEEWLQPCGFGRSMSWVPYMEWRPGPRRGSLYLLIPGILRWEEERR
jgi:hypothetical protein